MPAPIVPAEAPPSGSPWRPARRRRIVRRSRAALSGRRGAGPRTTPRACRGPAATATRRQRVEPGLGAPDDQLLDLRGALVERGHPHVAVVALDRVVVDVARPAVDLDREVRAVLRRLGRVELRDRRLGGRRAALVLEEAGAVDEHPRGVGLHAHVGDHRLHELERRDRAPELLALLGVGDRGVERALADADAARGDRVAAGVERAHGDLEAVADLAHQRVVVDLHGVEVERAVSEPWRPILPWISWRREALGRGRDEERGEPAVPFSGSVWAKISATSA